MGNLDQFAPNYATLYLMIYFKDISDMLSRIGTIGVQLVEKSYLWIYREIPSCGKFGNLDPSWTNIMQPYISWFDLRIYLKILIMIVKMSMF